jgi:hypothetical protein
MKVERDVFALGDKGRQEREDGQQENQDHPNGYGFQEAIESCHMSSGRGTVADRTKKRQAIHSTFEEEPRD